MSTKEGNSKKRFYFRLPDEFSTLSEAEKDTYLDNFAKKIWQTMATENGLMNSTLPEHLLEVRK
jgi:hypothetical protein